MRNIQIQRDEIRTDTDAAPRIDYYLGWGKEGKLQGDPMTLEELRALHTLIGRVIARESQTK